MTFEEIMIRMYPAWIMGIMMMIATYRSSHKELLRVDAKALKKFGIFMIWVTLWRLIMLKLFDGHDIMGNAISKAAIIPWQTAFTVFWEDACHGLPLVLLASYVEGKKYAKWICRAALAVVMVSFGLGHVYQGFLAAALLSFYIPFSVNAGKKHGFGTVMLCHMFYDLVTILTIKHALG